MRAVILANGKFPEHPHPLGILSRATTLVCCDGAIEHLEARSITPNVLVGDLDSISDHLKSKYSQILHHDPDQYSNDLTKAVKWCELHGIKEIAILGATGKREDHTIGNIGLLINYARLGIEVEIVSDTGILKPLMKSTKIDSYKGQQVSVFSTNNNTIVYTKNLKYPIVNQTIPEWWMGTLNESLGDWFELVFAPGPVIVYQNY